MASFLFLKELPDPNSSCLFFFYSFFLPFCFFPSLFSFPSLLLFLPFCFFLMLYFSFFPFFFLPLNLSSFFPPSLCSLSKKAALFYCSFTFLFPPCLSSYSFILLLFFSSCRLPIKIRECIKYISY